MDLRTQDVPVGWHDPRDPELSRVEGTPNVNSVTIVGLGQPIVAEVVGSDAEKERGLQGHAPLGPQQGMWFPYDDRQRVSFWMGRVAFPIDIVFAASLGQASRYEVVKIRRNLRPGDLDPIEAIGVDGVLEVAAHRADSIGIGDDFQVQGAGQPAAMAAWRRFADLPNGDPDQSEEALERADLGRPANDRMLVSAQDDGAALRRFLVAFDQSATWGQIREVIAAAATARAQSGPESDPADRVRTLYEVNIAPQTGTATPGITDDPTFRERLGRIAKRHLDGMRFVLDFTEQGGSSSDGYLVKPHTWQESFQASFEGVQDVRAGSVVLSVRLA